MRDPNAPSSSSASGDYACVSVYGRGDPPGWTGSAGERRCDSPQSVESPLPLNGVPSSERCDRLSQNRRQDRGLCRTVGAARAACLESEGGTELLGIDKASPRRSGVNGSREAVLSGEQRTLARRTAKSWDARR